MLHCHLCIKDMLLSAQDLEEYVKREKLNVDEKMNRIIFSISLLFSKCA